MKKWNLVSLVLALTLITCVSAHATAVYSTVTGHWYELTEKIFTEFNDAQAYAESRGGHLATITTAEENLWISNTWLSPTGILEYALLGGHDMNTEGVWEWVTGEPWSFTNWIGIEPNNGADGEDWLGFKVYKTSLDTFWWVDGVGYGWLDEGRHDNPEDPPVYRAVVEYENGPPVPEPGTVALVGIGLLGLVGLRRFRKK